MNQYIFTLAQYETLYTAVVVGLILSIVIAVLIFVARTLKGDYSGFEDLSKAWVPVCVMLIAFIWVDHFRSKAYEKSQEVKHAVFSFTGDTVMILNEVNNSQPKLWTVLYKNNAGNYQKTDLPEEKLQKVK